MPPVVVAVTGSPAAGKSTIAAAVADTLQIPRLSRDDFKIGLGWSSAKRSGQGVVFDPVFLAAGGPFSVAAERAMVAAAGELAAHGVSFVVESSILPAELVDLLRDSAARVIAVHASADAATIAGRLQARAMTGDAGARRLLAQHAQGNWHEIFQPVQGAFATLVVDTTTGELANVDPIIRVVHATLAEDGRCAGAPNF